MEKTARYIQVNNRLMQKFSFASTWTKMFINRACNGHHYGSVLWDLYGEETNMVYNTWNASTRRMLRVCEKYADSHNLKFSTDIDPQKSKTKCMAFLKHEKELRGLQLCNNTLPWVGSGKHLGMRIENITNILG